MKTPTVNIGNRQSGRLFAKSIVSTSCISEDITRAIKRLTKIFSKRYNVCGFRYGMGETSSEILQSLRDVKLTVRKKFYDILIIKKIIHS